MSPLLLPFCISTVEKNYWVKCIFCSHAVPKGPNRGVCASCTATSASNSANDTIKRNESDVGDVVFEILAKTGFKFLCFILFLALPNYS